MLPPRGKTRPICHDLTKNLLFPKPSPRPSGLQDGRRRKGAGERKGPSLGRRRNEGPGAGGISSCSSPSNGSGKCDLLCIPGAVPWGDLSQQPWEGGADKEARQAERGPRGEAGGVRGRGQYRESGWIAGPAAAAAPGQWRGAAPGAALCCRHLNGRLRDAPHSVRPPRTGRPSVRRERYFASG